MLYVPTRLRQIFRLFFVIWLHLSWSSEVQANIPISQETRIGKPTEIKYAAALSLDTFSINALRSNR
ncbi:unnamed protein product [Arctia plantaginis]|uniref:Uncharacterized protein n=1 Tax=Arctia plantaginis TaxID=874455 RepID=A0A8S1BAK4_ARCPL|nr:unnamed protein product [Arctia plantaginis]